MAKTDKMEKMKKVKIELDIDIVNELIQLKKEVGDTYSDVIWKLFKSFKGK